jgi:hypothetical protein
MGNIEKNQKSIINSNKIDNKSESYYTFITLV